MVVGTDRADDDADRAFFGCDARPHEAAAAIEAIAATVLSRLHLVVDEDDLAFDRALGLGHARVEACQIGDLALDALGPRRAAVAQGCDRERLRHERPGARKGTPPNSWPPSFPTRPAAALASASFCGWAPRPQEAAAAIEA